MRLLSFSRAEVRNEQSAGVLFKILRTENLIIWHTNHIYTLNSLNRK